MSRSTDPLQRSNDGDQLGALEAQLRERSLEIAFLRLKCENLEHQIQRIHASNSWRVTAPIRKISSIMKGVRRTALHKRAANQSLARAPGTIARPLAGVLGARHLLAL